MQTPTQMNAPSTFHSRKVDGFIAAAPATNGTNVRTIGTNRPEATAMPPCFSKKACALSR